MVLEYGENLGIKFYFLERVHSINVLDLYKIINIDVLYILGVDVFNHGIHKGPVGYYLNDNFVVTNWTLY